MEAAPTGEPGDFTMECTVPAMSFVELVVSDHIASRIASESRTRSLLMLLPRLLLNPSLQLAFLVRVAQRGPVFCQYPVRLLQQWFFSSEIYWFGRDDAIEIGPGIQFPHPTNIIIGPGTRIGSNVQIYNCAQIGTDREVTAVSTGADRAPVFGDRCVVFGYTMVMGPYRIGHDAVVGTRVMVEADVPPGALQTLRRLRLAGDWAGLNRGSA